MTVARAVEILEQEKMDALKTRTPYNPDAEEKIEAYNMAIKELINRMKLEVLVWKGGE